MSETPTSLWASRAVTPNGLRERVRVVLEGGVIERVEVGTDPAARDTVFDGASLLPGLVDLQVNGAAGAAYDAPTREERERATSHHVARGTTSLLATLVSAPLDALEAAIARVADDVDPAGPILGLHVEGPFLAEAKAGAHDASVLCDPTPERIDRILERADGTLALMTLAPERSGALDAVARLARAGAVVAAGHSRATLEEMRCAIEAGLSFVTHVGNASEWPGRPYDEALGFRRSEPGVVGTFLFEERLAGSLILDGFHLHPELAGAIVGLRGPSRICLVSDAMPATGLGPGRYEIGGLEAEVHEAGYAVAPGGGLAGSVITLLDAVRVAVERAGIPLADAVAMASATPAHVIGRGDRKGSLRAGADADLLVLSPDWEPLCVFRGGHRQDAP